MSSVLYHIISQPIRDRTLYPLKVLEHLHPDLFSTFLRKYTDRKRAFILDVNIPFVNCRWADCVFLSDIHPQLISETLQSVDGESWQFKYLILEASSLDTRRMVRYNGRAFNDKASSDFTPFGLDMIQPEAAVPERTLQFYRDELRQKRRPLYWAFSPQFLHQGTISVAKYRVQQTA